MMKKLIALILVLIIPLCIQVLNSSEESLLVEVEENGFSKKDKNLSWEYIKDKLFEGKVDRKLVPRLKIFGPVLLDLKNATALDSLAVKTLLEEIRTVLPQKTITYFSDFTKFSFAELVKNRFNKKENIEGYSYREILSSTIKLDFEVENDSLEGENLKTGFYYNNDKIRNRNLGLVTLHFAKLYFSFNKNTSLIERKKHIQFEFLRCLCSVHPDESEALFLNIKYPINAVFNEPTYNIVDKEFTDIDKFLVKKLYSKNFEEEFSEYMYETYPWRYASLFLDKDLAKLKALVLISFLGVLIFILAFGLFKNEAKGFLNYFFPLFVVLLSLSNLHWMYVFIIEIGQSSESLKNIIDVFLYVLMSSIIVSSLLWFFEKKLIINSENFTYQFVLKLLLTFVCLNVPVLIGYFLGKTHGATTIYIPLFFAFLTLTLGRGLLIYLNYFSKSLIKQKELELSRLKEINAQNELKSLHAHINPHFLYNALNSIASLTQENAAKAEEMILSLSDLFRYSINRKGRKMSTIEDEVLMVENYLKIEKIRFEDRLNFTIDVHEGLLKKEIPMYILQPLVENAVKHGISKIKDYGSISLEIKQKKEIISVEIFDNGPDFPEGLFGGHGLQSVYDLLRLSYGESAMLNWENCPKKKIMILIPSKK